MLLDKIKNIFESLRERIEKPFQIRIFTVAVIFTCLFALLLNNLYTLQVVNGDTYSEEFIEKIERSVKLPGTRGNIYDADGNILAYNRL